MNLENLEDYENNVTNTCTELNFADHWKNFTLEQEVSRGALLRHKKSRRNTHDYFNDKVNIDLNEPSTSKPIHFNQIYGREPPCKSRKVRRKKSPKRCPIRIAELAVPTKRQCIETWRYKSRVLPNFMVDRLKQRVMDERPIVYINDAINCFKKKKKRTKKRSHKKSRTIVENDRMGEISMLCAIFGYKIILKLLRPLKISLNPCLERINKIVKAEIHEVLYKNISNQKQGKNKEHLDEIARKITLWAVNILEETDNKLLEEELRELEEEEGPVLDLIDNLMERVMNICELPYYGNANNADEKTYSGHILSSVKISKETDADPTKDSKIVLRKEEDYLDEFKGALEEDYENALNFTKGMYESMDRNEEFLQGDYIYEDDDSQYVSEHFRTEVQKIINEILCGAIAVKLQLEEKEDRNSQIGLTFVTETNIDLNKVIRDKDSYTMQDVNKNKKSPELEFYFNNGEKDKNQLVEKIFIAHDNNEVGNASKNKYLPEVTSDTDFEKNGRNKPHKALYSNSVIVKNKSKLENGSGSALLNEMKSDFNVKENDKNGLFLLDALDSNSDISKNKNQLEEDTELLSELKSNLNNEVKELYTIDSKAHEYSNIDKEKDVDVGNLKQNQIELKTGNTETANNENVQPHEELNDITERNVMITENIVSNQEGEDNITDFMDADNEDLTSSPQSSEQKQTTKDIADTSLRKLSEETVEDVNEEDKNKKVKFSDTNMDIGNKTQLITKFSQILMEIPSSNYIMQNIDFAPPNLKLLSNVDESWPEDVPIPTFKVTESVNKSVTSLGNIFEADEKKELSSENSYDFTRNSEIIINVRPFTSMSMDIVEIEEVLHAQFHKEKEIGEKLSATIIEADFQANEDQKQSIINRENETEKIKSKKSHVQGKYSKQPSDIKTNTSCDKSKNEKKSRKISNNKLKETERINIPKKYEYLPEKIDNIKEPNKIHKQRSDKQQQNFTITNSDIKSKFNNKGNGNRIVKTNAIDIEINSKDLKEKIEFQNNRPKQKSRESPNAIVELHQKISINYEYWKPNPYSCQSSVRRAKTYNSRFQHREIGCSDDYDIQNWCKNLESVIENLEIWNAWINSACKCIKRLSEKGKIKHSRSTEMFKTKWKTLHKYIKEDRILWKDIKRCNRDGLKGYKKYYNNKIGRTKNFQRRCNCSNI